MKQRLLFKRALGEKAAARCENASTPRCKCRCAGVAHGKARTQAAGGPATLYELPKTDPHHPAFRGDA